MLSGEAFCSQTSRSSRRMKGRLTANGYRFDSLVETIVSSPQFLNKRNTESRKTSEAPNPRRREVSEMSSKLIPQNRIPRKFERTISRRSILRGAGVAMALPFLNRSPRSARPPRRRSQSGSRSCSWAAASTRITGARPAIGADMKLSKTLSVLEPLKHKINVVDGLFNKASVGLGIHPAQTGSLLSGAQVSKGAILHSGMSVDQMIANTSDRTRRSRASCWRAIRR